MLPPLETFGLDLRSIVFRNDTIYWMSFRLCAPVHHGGVLQRYVGLVFSCVVVGDLRASHCATMLSRARGKAHEKNGAPLLATPPYMIRTLGVHFLIKSSVKRILYHIITPRKAPILIEASTW